MCGIFGVFNQSSSKPVRKEQLDKAVAAIRHRGPDAQVAEVVAPHVGFGHARLSIIDLGEQSNQPFHYDHLVMVFNGEVYNYIELREELIKAGYQFRTKCDTEVIPAAYLHWGEDCVTHFNGMWAFAIYDSKKEQLFCSRDRFGVKPFNYAFYEGSFLFASEIKAILAYEPALKKPNYNSIARYCRETVGAQAKETWFEGIFRMLPGHNLVLTREGHTFKQYWKFPKITNNAISFEEAKEEYLRLFNDSVLLRMRSDVPVGLTLSGGVDSASIACSVKQMYADPLKAFTASFPKQPFNEYDIAKDLCNQLGFDSIEVRVEYEHYVDKLRKIVYHLESGHGSPAIYPLWHITERASKDITVFLEGQGADEILGGYINTIFVDFVRDLLAKGNIQQALSEISIHSKDWSLVNAALLNFRLGTPATVRKLFRYFNGTEQIYKGHLKEHSPYFFDATDMQGFDTNLNKKLALLHQTGLVNLLHYGDAISMAHSLENRLPFMDFKLVEFVSSLPAHFKVKDGLGKYIHRKAVEKTVPAAILDNKKKLGFLSPLRHIFFEEKFGALDILTGNKLKERNLFNKKEVQKLINNHRALRVNNERMLFKILSTELWFQNFIDD